MKMRKNGYGDKNIVGRKIEALRKSLGIDQKDFVARLQVLGVNIDDSSYSKLEGQIRKVSDRELYAIAKALNVSIDSLFE
ncbi:MAG: helix-turn-helix transcriptional regulator [Clostridia bacterium]|nr:helix-turn-helix transcriptional regulator [Clostridia bacterium]MBQ4602634.1 helix-turn-helix transcriptional regulator [Clostridia bacterium]